MNWKWTTNEHWINYDWITNYGSNGDAPQC